jgi:hypothetical protein
MSFTFFAHDDLNFAPVAALAAGTPAEETIQSWESLAGEIRRLFKIAITSSSEARGGKGRIVVAAQRILDATASMALIAELEAGERQARMRFSAEQCETEAQRLFDAYMDGRQAEVLCAYAERGLMAAYGLMDTPVAVSH